MGLIPRKPVKSSLIESVGYDPSSRSLDVAFHGKKDQPPLVYRYQNVQPKDHAALMGAESIGKHFGNFIRKDAKRFTVRKLTAEELRAV